MGTSSTGIYTSVGREAGMDEPIIQPLCSIFRRFLKKQGLKFTPERAKILDAVLNKEGVFEAEQLYDGMRHVDPDHRVSKATVYRTLKHLVEAGIVSEVLIDSRQVHYRLSVGKEPMGHLVCMETNRIVEFSSQMLMEIRNEICRQHGFELVSHRFVIYGVSPEAGEDDAPEA